MDEQTDEAISLRELSRQLGLPEPETAILNDALHYLEGKWPLTWEGLQQALLDALDAVPRVRRDGIDDHSHVPAQAAHDLLDRAERAEGERDELWEFVENVAAHERDCTHACAEKAAQAKLDEHERRAALSADADADVGPSHAEGDDGRSRAIEAATKALQHWRVTLIDRPSNYARCAIDAALASGGVAVVTGCPDCGFTYDATHVDERVGGYWCPACEAKDLEKRLMAARAALEDRDG